MATIEELYWVNVTKEKPKANAVKSKSRERMRSQRKTMPVRQAMKQRRSKDEKKEEKTDEKEESNDSNATEEPEVVFETEEKET